MVSGKGQNLAVGFAGLLSGCMATPTPLAPGLEGSVGAPHHGVQTSAAELPQRGPGYVRFRAHSRHYWGQLELVRTVEAAARAVVQTLPDSPPLVVGDLSAQHGGRIPGHSSHRTGRDVDLLWYVTTLRGAPTSTPGFVPLGSDGLASVPGSDQHLMLDLERQWLLFKALLTSQYAGVQWMFVSRDVEALLVDYALARGESPELVWRAEAVMRQPTDSSPHDDHVHVRIACSTADMVHGCTGGGPHWEWFAPLPELGPLSTRWLEELGHDDPLGATQWLDGLDAADHDA